MAKHSRRFGNKSCEQSYLNASLLPLFNQPNTSSAGEKPSRKHKFPIGISILNNRFCSTKNGFCGCFGRSNVKKSRRKQCIDFLTVIVLLILLDMFSLQLIGYSSGISSVILSSTRALKNQYADFNLVYLIKRHKRHLQFDKDNSDQDLDVYGDNLDFQIEAKTFETISKDELNYLACAQSDCLTTSTKQISQSCAAVRQCQINFVNDCKKNCVKSTCEDICAEIPKLNYVEREQKKSACYKNCEGEAMEKQQRCKKRCKTKYETCKTKCRKASSKLSCLNPNDEQFENENSDVVNADWMLI